MGRVIAVDFDDVIADTNTALAEFHNKNYGTNYTRAQVTRYDFSLHWGVDKVEQVRRFDEYVQTVHHDDMQLVAGVREALAELRRDGWRVIIITSRPERYLARTKVWLKQNLDGQHDEVFCTDQFLNPDSSVTKASLAHTHGAQVFIEDAPHHAEELSRAGIPVLLFDTPWNQDLKDSQNITRVKSWQEAVDWITKELPL